MLFPRPTQSVGSCIRIEVALRWRKRFEHKNRYRYVFVDGVEWAAHRLSYALNIEAIPRQPVGGATAHDGLVLHTCDNKWCVNPDHLYLGNKVDNDRDRQERTPGLTSRLFGNDKPKTKEHKQKIATALLGKTKSESHKKALSESAKRRRR